MFIQMTHLYRKIISFVKLKKKTPCTVAIENIQVGNKNPVISIYRKFPLLYIVSTVLTHIHAYISKSKTRNPQKS